MFFDRSVNKVRLISHRIFQPTKAEPLNFEATVERTIKELCSRFSVRGIYYDPYQMASVTRCSAIFSSGETSGALRSAKPLQWAMPVWCELRARFWYGEREKQPQERGETSVGRQ